MIHFRWGHSGYKEQYPLEFNKILEQVASDSDVSSNFDIPALVSKTHAKLKKKRFVFDRTYFLSSFILFNTWAFLYPYCLSVCWTQVTGLYRGTCNWLIRIAMHLSDTNIQTSQWWICWRVFDFFWVSNFAEAWLLNLWCADIVYI